jgi:hypothetical protein
VLSWEEIESGKLDRDQARFDAMQRDLGEPLYQLIRALKQNDHAAALVPAEKLFPTYINRRSHTAEIVANGLLWGLLARGERERAVVPLFVLVRIDLQKTRGERPIPLPGRRFPLEARRCFSTEFLPIFLNKEAARATLPQARELASDATLPRVREVATEVSGREGGHLYLAALAIAAGDLELGSAELSKLPEEARQFPEARAVIAAQLKMAKDGPAAGIPEFEQLLSSDSAPTRVMARLALGAARVSLPDEAERRAGVIDLLHVPALNGESHPDTAAAAIELACKTLEDLGDAESRVIRQELKARFPAWRSSAEARP